MAQKRPLSGDGGGSGDGGDDSKSSEKHVKVESNGFYRTFKLVKMERNLLAYMPLFESFMRGIVREEVHKSLASGFSSRHGQVESSESRRYQLQFETNLPDTLYTEDNEVALKVILVDSCSKKTVTSGLLSSIKVKIVVVHSHFEQDDWTANEFNSKVVKSREGKRPLLTKALTVSLHEGVASISKISFGDNSRWCNSSKFRLGAQPVSDSDKTSIREAISNPFKIRHQRGKYYQKLDTPSLDSEVWKLKYIARNGIYHNSLESSGISTVGDLLKLHFTDKRRLSKLLSDSSNKKSNTSNHCSNKKLDTIIKHALTCPDDGKIYMYRILQQETVLYFDSGYRIVGVEFDPNSYLSMANINQDQKERVEAMKQDAYKNSQHFQKVAETSSDQNPSYRRLFHEFKSLIYP